MFWPVRMTKEHVAKLVALAREDSALWEEMKLRELEIEKRLAAAAQQGPDFDDRDLVADPPKLPTLVMLVSDLVARHYGPAEGFEIGTVTVSIRLTAREELGLPA
jgi:hypothetical protein